MQAQEGRVEGRDDYLGVADVNGAEARDAGNSYCVPRVSTWPKGGILGGRTHRKFVHVGAPEWNCAGVLQTTDHSCVVGSDVTFQDLRCTATRMPSHIDDVLDCNGNTGQRQIDIGFS